VLSASVVTPENLTLLQSAILARCDMLDGVKDGVVDDPRACAFRVADLSACPEDRPGRHCLTRAQRAAVERIYTPSSQLNLPPRPFGGEDELSRMEGLDQRYQSQSVRLVEGQRSSPALEDGRRILPVLRL
jgi:Tannase and feruloyl esterase